MESVGITEISSGSFLMGLPGVAVNRLNFLEELHQVHAVSHPGVGLRDTEAWKPLKSLPMTGNLPYPQLDH